MKKVIKIRVKDGDAIEKKTEIVKKLIDLDRKTLLSCIMLALRIRRNVRKQDRAAKHADKLNGKVICYV